MFALPLLCVGLLLSCLGRATGLVVEHDLGDGTWSRAGSIDTVPIRELIMHKSSAYTYNFLKHVRMRKSGHYSGCH